MKRPVIGIDLGTTNSCVAFVDETGHNQIIPNRQGDTTMPSVAAFEVIGSELRSVIGVPAKRNAVTNPERTIAGVKRLIGRRYDDKEVQELARTLPYALVPAPNGDAWISTCGLQMSPPEISALLLRELKFTAEQYLGSPVEEAIITVPAHFDNEQRRATRDAAEIAGLKVRRLLNEPTAAALGYGAHRGGNRRIAVCDLGGGTFDVSIVNVEGGIIEVISTTGDLFLGGEDIDRLMVEHLIEEIASQTGVDLHSDPQALQRLREASQTAKHSLSAVSSAEIDLKFLFKVPGGRPFDFKRKLVRGELDAWCRPLAARLEKPCREAAAQCGLDLQSIEEVVLVGGMTRMPFIQNQIATIFGKPPLKVVNPDEIVAIGAATQCAILDGSLSDCVLLDVTSRALAITTHSGVSEQVIPRNSTIPTREHKIVATTQDNQTEIVLDVYEGESRDSTYNRHLGRYACRQLPAQKAGDVVVRFDFTIDVDGILRVSAFDLGSNRPLELRLKATAGLSRAAIEKLQSVVTAK